MKNPRFWEKDTSHQSGKVLWWEVLWERWRKNSFGASPWWWEDFNGAGVRVQFCKQWFRNAGICRKLVPNEEPSVAGSTRQTTKRIKNATILMMSMTIYIYRPFINATINQKWVDFDHTRILPAYQYINLNKCLSLYTPPLAYKWTIRLYMNSMFAEPSASKKETVRTLEQMTACTCMCESSHLPRLWMHVILTPCSSHPILVQAIFNPHPSIISPLSINLGRLMKSHWIVCKSRYRLIFTTWESILVQFEHALWSARGYCRMMITIVTVERFKFFS